MAARVHVAADGFIHTLCPGAACGAPLRVRPPRTASRYRCPVPGCGCSFRIAPVRGPAAADPASGIAPEEVNVWEEVMRAVCAEQGRTPTLVDRPTPRRRWSARAGRPHARFQTAAVGVVAIGLGLGILASSDVARLLASADHAPPARTGQFPAEGPGPIPSAPSQPAGSGPLSAEQGPMPHTVAPESELAHLSIAANPASAKSVSDRDPVDR